jgi:hypothetical protein
MPVLPAGFYPTTSSANSLEVRRGEIADQCQPNAALCIFSGEQQARAVSFKRRPGCRGSTTSKPADESSVVADGRADLRVE